MAKGTDVATREPYGKMKKPTADAVKAAYAAILDGAELPHDRDPQVVSRAIMLRIVEAESFEDAFRTQNLDAWRDHLNRPAFVESFHLNPSSIDGGTGPGVYAVVDLSWGDTGEKATVTCGGANVLTQLVKMLERGWFDRPVQLIAKPTREGFDALWLEDASNPLD